MIKRIPDIFTRPFQHWEKLQFFRMVLYIFLLINALTLLPIAQELFGYSGIVGSRGWNTGIVWYKQGSQAVLNVLSHPANYKYTWVYQFFVYGQIVTLILGLFRVWPKIMSVLIYFFTVNLFLKGFLAFTGGEVLINILLFYLIFIQRSDRRSEKQVEPQFTMIQNVLNNTFFILILVQVCILYFFSTLYKLLDEHWLSGEALMYISRIDGFSGNTLRWLFAESPLLSLIATYFALGYQALFPVLVWFKRIKIPFLLCGVALHLLIAFGMGIFTFGIVMVLVYIPFLDIGHINSLKKRLRLSKMKGKVNVEQNA